MERKNHLVVLPRKKHKVHAIGNDIWNCYEASALLNSGCSFTGVFRLSFDASSQYIIESESLSEYLHSFSMVQMGRDIDEASLEFQNRVVEDLSQALKTPINGIFHTRKNVVAPPIFGEFNNYDMYQEMIGTCAEYVYNKNLLKKNELEHSMRSAIHTDLFQHGFEPSSGSVYLYYKSKFALTISEYIKYIISFRNDIIYSPSELCELIYSDLWDFLSPDELFVACLFIRNEGIDTNYVRANKEHLIYRYANNLITLSFLQEKGMR